MRNWTICCGSCNHRWDLMGECSDYERLAIESRPCPSCHAYTLKSPEPKPSTHKSRPLFWTTRRVSEVRVAG